MRNVSRNWIDSNQICVPVFPPRSSTRLSRTERWDRRWFFKMSSNLVIAAIPDENDRVWKVSSEKVPHLTLLFLGDVEAVKNLDQIILFVEHAANTTLRRFYLPVDRRGEL